MIWALNMSEATQGDELMNQTFIIFLNYNFNEAAPGTCPCYIIAESPIVSAQASEKVTLLQNLF